MEIALLVLAIILLITGILGSFLPVLPGPPLSWAGLLLLHFTKGAEFSTAFLLITGLITLVLTVVDYVLPSWAVKKRGGTKLGERGALIGALVGVLLGPLGIILGPFVGAFIGEYIANQGDHGHALRIAFSSFVGFLLSTGVKLVWCLLLAYWFLKEAF